MIAISDQHYPAQAKQLSQQLGLPLCSQFTQPAKMYLEWLEDKPTKNAIQPQHPKLSLCLEGSGPVAIDFVAGKKAHRRQFGGGKGQPLVRAMGQIDGKTLSILDATAGMGGDSFVLASLGFNVHMVERSPIVAALLADALQRAQTEALHDVELIEILQRLTLSQADSTRYLEKNHPQVDVVYLDPMYPEKKKNAATKKEMKALQQLVGPDLDSEALLTAALKTAQYRVVVKRPKNAPAILGFNGKIHPSTAVASPNTRYDIYVIKALTAAGLL